MEACLIEQKSDIKPDTVIWISIDKVVTTSRLFSALRRATLK
jgi:hypothetical protein